MKPHVLVLSFFILLLATGCKFTSTTEGIYKGTYTAYGMPSTSGDGTLHITSAGSGKFNITLNTTGNPDVFFTNVTINRQGTLNGGYFTGGNEYAVDTSYLITVYETDYYDRSPWKAYFDYDEHTSLNSISFEGNRIN